MSRIKKLFEQKTSAVLNIYCTAGYPALESTMPILKALQNNGVDMVELGMPYSDPLADGPVIQASSARALENGMTITILFEQLRELREQINLPVVLMGYLNPLLQFGFERFCKKAAEVGVDGLIIPDMPPFEYQKEYRAIVEQYGLDFIFLVTPETTEERLHLLDDLSTGFLYAVSSSSVTGSDKNFSDVSGYLERLKGMKLKNPVLVGFGIKDKETFHAASSQANGAIIGSAFVRAIEKAENIEAATKSFVEGVLK